jgi:hypothetical protein
MTTTSSSAWVWTTGAGGRLFSTTVLASSLDTPGIIALEKETPGRPWHYSWDEELS